jgi:hypothetical protein
MKTVIAIALMLASQLALAATDWKCMNDCSSAGHMYGYCKRICSY